MIPCPSSLRCLLIRSRKGITINEPTSQPPALPAPVKGIGKKVLVESPRLPKKQKRGTEHEPSLLDPVPRKPREVKTQFHMKLHPNAEDFGTAVVVGYSKFLVEGCSAIAPEVWDRFKSNQTGALLNFGLMSSLVVSILLRLTSLFGLISSTIC